jgi:hypothetical protein
MIDPMRVGKKPCSIILCLNHETFTEQAVLQLARQAYERCFKVVFGSDVTSTDDPSMQEPELKTLRKGFARVMTSARIISELT